MRKFEKTVAFCKKMCYTNTDCDFSESQKGNGYMKIRPIALLTAIMLMTLTGCSGVEQQNDSYVIDIGSMGIPDETEPPTNPPFTKADVSILAVGENMIHSSVYKTASAHAAEGDTYDFRYCYQHIDDRIPDADISLINQSTLICNDEMELAGGSDIFNSPVELGYTLADMGFDVMNISSRHVLDKGAEGLEKTLNYWDNLQKEYANVSVVGAYRSEQDMQNYRIIEKDDLSIGFLSYTTSTNDRTLPEDTSLIVPMAQQEDLMQRQIKALSRQADSVIVCINWGTPDSTEVEDSQKELAKKIIDWGADVIIGTGSHTLQSMEYISRSDGTKGFVFYSLGNFISAQTENINMIGGMGEFRICRDNQGNISVQDVQVTPVITQFSSSMTDVQSYPYDEYTKLLMEKHNIPYFYGNQWDWEFIDSVVEENIPKKYQKNYTNQSSATEPPTTEEDEEKDEEENEEYE